MQGKVATVLKDQYKMICRVGKGSGEQGREIDARFKKSWDLHVLSKTGLDSYSAS